MSDQRMTTSVERVFKKLPDGLIREITISYIHFLNAAGDIIRSKLDKSIPGRLFKRATENERSQYGEVMYLFPDEEVPVRLIALGMDYQDGKYGRSL